MEPHGGDDRRSDSHPDRREDTCTVVLTRGGSQGFGFSLTGSNPVLISRVEKGSAADVGGLRMGDSIVKVNGLNLSRSSKQTVAKVIKNSTRHMVLDVVPHDLQRQISQNSQGYNSTALRESSPETKLHSDVPEGPKYTDHLKYFKSSKKHSICRQYGYSYGRHQACTGATHHDKKECWLNQCGITEDKENCGIPKCPSKRGHVLTPATDNVLYSSPQKCVFSQTSSSTKLCSGSRSKKKSSPSCVSYCITPMGESFCQSLAGDVTPKRLDFRSPKQRRLISSNNKLDHGLSVTCSARILGRPQTTEHGSTQLCRSQKENDLNCERSERAFPVNPIDISAIVDTGCDHTYEEISGGYEDSLDNNSSSSLLNTALWSPLMGSSSEQEDITDDVLDPASRRDHLNGEAAASHSGIFGDVDHHPVIFGAQTGDFFSDMGNEMAVSLAAKTRELIECEQEFIGDMLTGIQGYSRPLRHCILTSKQHRLLFQNAEKLCAIAEGIVKSLKQFGDPEHIYQSKLTVLCEAYATYISGLSTALSMLTRWKEIPQFHHFLQQQSSQEQDGISRLEDFLHRPVIHLKELGRLAPTTFGSTVLLSQGLDLVAQALHSMKCCQRTKPGSVDTSSGVHSLTSSSASSFHQENNLCHFNRTASSCKSHISSSRMRRCRHTPLAQPSINNKESESCSGSSSCPMATPKKSRSQGHMMTTCRSTSSECSHCSQSPCGRVDPAVVRIQNTISYPKHIQQCPLPVPSRHLIYSGKLLLSDSCSHWQPIQMFLFNDLALVVQQDKRGSFTEVAREAVDLHRVTYLPSNAHPSQFCLSATRGCCTSTEDIHLRCYSIEDMCTWTHLLEHHISACRTLRKTTAPD